MRLVFCLTASTVLLVMPPASTPTEAPEVLP